MTYRKLFLLSVLAVSASAFAQGGGVVSGGGCSQSPENPTVVLSLVGASGFAAAALRGKVSSLLAKRRSR